MYACVKRHVILYGELIAIALTSLLREGSMRTEIKNHVKYRCNQDNVYGAVIMTQSHRESSPGSRDECRTAPDGC